MRRPRMEPGKRIVRTYYALTGLFTFAGALIWGVNTLVMLDAGLTIVGAFAANAAFSAAQVLFEIPTGVIADTRGRRFSFLLGAAALTIASAIVVGLSILHAPLVWWLAANVLLGLGFALHSGATEAWFVDALQAAQGPTELDGYFARTAQVFGLGTLVGALAGGLLGDIALWIPWATRAALLIALFAVGILFMHDEGFRSRRFHWEKVTEEVRTVWRTSLEHGWNQRPVRMLMLLSFLQMGFLIWGWYAWQPHFLALLGRDAIWVAGVIAAFVSLAMMLGNQLVAHVGLNLRRPTVLVIASGVLAASILAVGLSSAFIPAVGFFLVAMISFGVMGPTKQSALHRLIPSQTRATVISFDSLLGSAGGVGSQVALAKLAQSRGYAAGYLVGGAFLLIGVPLAMMFRRLMGEQKAAPDVLAADA